MNHPSQRQVVVAILLAIALSLAGGAALSTNQASAGTPVALPPALLPPTATPPPTPIPSPTPSPTPPPTPRPQAATGGSPMPQPTATPSPSPTPTATATATPVPTPTPVPIGTPVRFKIPAIKVDTDVEQVGLTADGAMDTPKNYDNVGWYTLGPKPGEPGNATIAGHVDSKRGTAVFWDLRKLKPGDEIFVIGSDGVERRFVVTLLEFYYRPEAPLQRIFGPAPGIHLNVITCAGTFHKDRAEYDQVLVVYTDFAP